MALMKVSNLTVVPSKWHFAARPEFTPTWFLFSANIILFIEYGAVTLQGQVSSSLILLTSRIILQLFFWVYMWQDQNQIVNRVSVCCCIYLSGWGLGNTILDIRHSGMTRANIWALSTSCIAIFFALFFWLYHSRAWWIWKQELRRRTVEIWQRLLVRDGEDGDDTEMD
jgi:hypothetical protein